MGTIKSVPNELKLETPVAENLMMGLAIGMSFKGFRPVVYLERMDFSLVAADAIVNHVDKIERISHGEFKVPVIIRTVVSDSGPFYSGPTHSQDLSEGFKKMVTFPVEEPKTGKEVLDTFEKASNRQYPTMVIERKSYY
jgi:pyruvate/2-oxoglutarate/acetoin dehydrogenase E1 component